MWTKWNAQVDSWPPAILQKSSINFIIIININIIRFIVFFSTLISKIFQIKIVLQGIALDFVQQTKQNLTFTRVSAFH